MDLYRGNKLHLLIEILKEQLEEFYKILIIRDLCEYYGEKCAYYRNQINKAESKNKNYERLLKIRYEFHKDSRVVNQIKKEIDLETLENEVGELLGKFFLIDSEKGYEIRYGKYIAVKKKEDNRFLRLDSLGEGYTQQDLSESFVKQVKFQKKKKGYQRSLSLLIDVQEKIKEGKGGGYTHWAKVFNVKQMAQTILFLQEHDFESFEQLDAATNEKVKKFNEISSQIKYLEKQLGDSKELKKQIINYSKTRDTYVEYRKTGYSKKFREAHREEIQMHKEAKATFDKLGVSKIPRVRELNQQISEVYDNRRNIVGEYYQLKEEMRKMMVVRENVKRILNENKQTREYMMEK